MITGCIIYLLSLVGIDAYTLPSLWNAIEFVNDILYEVLTFIGVEDAGTILEILFC